MTEKRLALADMLRTTGNNTAEFMDKVAAHVEKLEQELFRLQTRVQELESQSDDFK